MSCTLCNHMTEVEGLCQRCHNKIHSQLEDLGDFWLTAHDELLPGSGGNGSSNSERSIGVSVTALSFIAGDDILGVLHEWEKVIRMERKLIPPAMLKKQSNVGAEIDDAIKFAQTHLQWSGTQEWVGDYAREIRELHQMGMQAARAFVAKARRIPCPSTQPDGEYCNNLLRINHDDPLDIFTCKKCQAEWTTLRLVAVALSDPTNEVWLDAEAIGQWMSLPERQVYRIIKKNQVARKGQLYNVKQFIIHAKTTI